MTAVAGETQALIDRYQSWRGGAYFKHLQRMHTVAKVRVDGMDGTRSVWIDSDDRLAERLDLGAMSTHLTISKTEAWFKGLDRRVDALDPVFSAAKQRVSRILMPSFIGRPDVIWRIVGQEKRHGGTWSVVEARFPDDLTIALFIDPRSGALDGARVTEAQGSHYSHYADWRWLDGVRVPFLETTESAEHEDNAETPAVERLQYSSITLNSPAPQELFAKPHSPSVATFASSEGSTGWLPFAQAGADIFLSIEVAGRQVEALLDSGVSISHFDAGFAHAIGLGGQGAFEVRGTSGVAADTQVAAAPTISIGAMNLNGLNIGVSDLGSIARSFGRPVPVVLGQDLFDDLVVDIDFAQRRVAFIDPSRYAAPDGMTNLPVAPSPAGPTVDVRIESSETARMTLDLGNSGAPFLFYASYWKPREMLTARRHSRVLSEDIAGASASEIASLGLAELGSFQFKDAPALFVGLDKGSGDLTPAGSVGLSALNRFRMVFDYPHGLLRLSPTETVDAPFPKDRSGLGLDADGRGWRVVFIAPGSPAEAEGWRLGDRIAEIINDPVNAKIPIVERWGEGPEGAAITFVMADGSRRQLTLRAYY